MNFNHLRAKFCRTGTKSSRGGRWWDSLSPTRAFLEAENCPNFELEGFQATWGHTAPQCPFATLQPLLHWFTPGLFLFCHLRSCNMRPVDLLHHFYSTWAPHAVLCWARWLLRVTWDCNALACPITQASCLHWGASGYPLGSSIYTDF